MHKVAVYGAISAALLFSVSKTYAQLRIVNMNGANSASASSGPRTGMGTILVDIGARVSDDPTTPGNTGIAKPIDILCLQEAFSSTVTGSAYANLLNTSYGTTAYSYAMNTGTLAGASTGSGTQAVVYNTNALTLIGTTVIGTASTSGQPRQTIRYQFRPVGYGASADIYVYNGHWKASSDSTSANRRNIESTAIRADTDNVNSVPTGANIIYAGDLNVYDSTEAMYQTLESNGNGKAFDPINKPGHWNSNAAFVNIHTQSPFNPATDPGNGFSGTTGGMDDRFDQQLISSNMNDGTGVAYIPNSYQCWGNNGTHPLNGYPNQGTGAPANVLFYESSILDHLPVVADYQIPAKMTASVAAVPTQVIVGASVPVNVSVSNSAPVSFANGADHLVYSVAGTGNVSGSANGNATALAAANVHALSLSTATPGSSSGTVTVNSTSQAVANGSFSQQVTTTVLAHSNASFASPADQNSLSIDYGIRPFGVTAPNMPFAVSNLADASGFTAKLNLVSINGSGSTAALTTNATTFANLVAAASHAYQASLDTSNYGIFSATYTLNVSDENLPGATSGTSLSLTLTGTVAIPGDANLDWMVDSLDYNALAANYGLESGAQWINGDFNRDGLVDSLDYNALAAHYGTSVPPPAAPSASVVVPEPGTISLLMLGVTAINLRRRRAS